MPQHFSNSPLRSNGSSSGLPEIVGGLSLLVATTWQPAFPAATGMALVMLGATRLTILRFQRSEGFIPLLFLNTAIYGTLVALCIGARVDHPCGTKQLLQRLILADLAICLWPVAAPSRSYRGPCRASPRPTNPPVFSQFSANLPPFRPLFFDRPPKPDLGFPMEGGSRCSPHFSCRNLSSANSSQRQSPSAPLRSSGNYPPDLSLGAIGELLP